MMDPIPPGDLREALVASERRAHGLQARLDATQAMIDAISEAIYVLDAEGHFLEVNEGAARMYGYPKAFIIGKTAKVLSAPGRNNSEAMGQAFGRALQGEPQQFEFWGQRRNGHLAPREVRLYPGIHLGQKVVIAVAQDISGRKRAEQVRDAAYRISEAALEAKALPALYRSVHDILRTLLPAENCFIALHDARTDTLSWPYWADQVDEVPPVRRSGRGLTEYVIRTGLPQLLNETKLAALVAAGEAESMGAESLAWMGVPLRNDQRVFGALVIQSYEGGYSYLPEDLEILAFVSSQIAMAIDRMAFDEKLRFVSAAVNGARDSLFWINEGGSFEIVNDATCLGLGYTREELLTLTIQDIDPTVTAESWKIIWESVRNGTSVSRETTQRRKDGTFRPVELTRVIVTFEGRELLFVSGRDITQRKLAEAALRAAEQRLRTVVANSQAVIYQLDPEGRFLLSEGLGLANLGLAPGQVVGLSALEVYRDDGEALTQIRRALKGESSRQMTQAGGRLFDNFLTPVFDEQGQVNSVIGIATDVTERQQIEEALRAERGLFVGGPVMVIRWKAAPLWPVDYISPNIQTILGYAPEDLTSGRISFDSLIHPEDRHRIHQESNFLRLKGKTHFEQQYRIRNAAGQYRWFQDFTATSSPESSPLYYLGYMLDITDLLQAEEALRQSQKLESLGILAGGIAHDFNNLLTVVLGNLNLAQMNLPENAKAQPYLAKMEATVLRATELTKQMLAYSGRGHFIVKSQDLNDVVREVTHLLEVSISKKIHLRFDLEPGIPAIRADGAQIQQVVMNLVTNAADAIGDREGVIHLSTSAALLEEPELQSVFRGEALMPGRYILLEVADTGIGMSPEVLARIFDPFFTTKVAGRGLGLSAMLGILRGHHAGLRITSEVGRGSSFRLCFPASEEQPVPSPPVIGEVASHPLRGRILLVDDEDLILLAIGSALETLGLEVLTAKDGLEALERFREAGPRLDLVLMDLTMPRMDGQEAFQAMHDLDPSIPVVLTSGFTEQDSLQTLSGHGPAGFIQKPYQIKELRNLLQRLLGD